MALQGRETGAGKRSPASPRPPPLEQETGGLSCSAAAAGPDGGFRHVPVPQNQTHDIEDGEVTLPNTESELNQRKLMIHDLQTISTEHDKRKTDLLSEIQVLHHRLKNEGPRHAVERMMSVLKVLKDLEKRESDFRSSSAQKCISMQQGIMEFEDICYHDGNKADVSVLDQSIVDAQEKLNLSKRELGARLRAILSRKRQIDDFPAQTELIQYEHRFSELYVQIQERHRQTRKHYDTYNALLEIKELMLKEISLLNSISSQFQEAIVDTTGRSKLIDSMEAIAKGTQQKLKKVEVALDSEQRLRDSLKERYSTAITVQRRFSSLSKAFQEECAKHERLRNVTSA